MTEYQPGEITINETGLHITLPTPIGNHVCPCCGNATYGSDLLCSECQSADCQETTDATGETGYANCEVPDDDDEYSEYGDVDGYDRNGAWDGFQVTSDAEGGL